MLKTWFLAIFTQNAHLPTVLKPGMRVRTPHGVGLIESGCVNVRLENPTTHQRSIHQYSVGCNITKIEEA